MDTIRGMAHTRLEGDSGDDDAAADVPPGASSLHAPPQRSLAEAAAALRAQMQRVRGGGGGRSSRRRGEDDEGPVLSGEQAERLQGVFPKYCGARKKSAALEAMAGEVGEEVEPQQVRRAMKELGLKFGQLTPPMVRPCACCLLTSWVAGIGWSCMHTLWHAFKQLSCVAVWHSVRLMQCWQAPPSQPGSI